MLYVIWLGHSKRDYTYAHQRRGDIASFSVATTSVEDAADIDPNDDDAGEFAASTQMVAVLAERERQREIERDQASKRRGGK